MRLSTAEDLYNAIRMLKESERDEQKALEKQFKKRKVHKEEDLEEKDEEGEESSEEPADEEPSEEEPADEEPASQDDKKKNDKLAGAKELNDIPQELPKSLKGSDFVDRINKIRAGSSLQDDKIKNKVVNYVRSLTSDERNDLWVNLDSLARIVLGGVDPAQVLTPSLVTGPNRKKNDQVIKNNKKQVKKDSPKSEDLPVVAPVVTVSEGVKKKLTEVPYVLRSNKTVPFGHTSHVKDLERMYSDLLRLRSCQEPRSESYMSLSLALKTIRSQLAMALKKSGNLMPTIDTQEIEVIPKLVEED
jgi:hypothetical protein